MCLGDAEPRKEAPEIYLDRSGTFHRMAMIAFNGFAGGVRTLPHEPISQWSQDFRCPLLGVPLPISS